MGVRYSAELWLIWQKPLEACWWKTRLSLWGEWDFWVLSVSEFKKPGGGAGAACCAEDVVNAELKPWHEHSHCSILVPTPTNGSRRIEAGSCIVAARKKKPKNACCPHINTHAGIPCYCCVGLMESPLKQSPRDPPHWAPVGPSSGSQPDP